MHRFGRVWANFIAALWVFLVGMVVFATVSVMFARLGWVFDLLANLAVYFFWTALLFGLVSLSLGNTKKAVILLLCMGILSVPFSKRRAIFTESSADVRVLIHNTHSTNANILSVLDGVRASGADVVVLVEVNPVLVRLLIHDNPLEEVYPYMVKKGPIRDITPWRIILSKWPLEDRTTKEVVGCVVRSPAGPFGLIAVHPASPRNVSRWKAGTRLVEKTTAVVRGDIEEGLPVIVAGDLNSTPTGWRSELLCARGDLARCKPMLHWQGTYPASLPGFVALAIDDAWVSSDWRVVSWRTVGSFGSDHRAVEIGLTLFQ